MPDPLRVAIKITERIVREHPGAWGSINTESTKRWLVDLIEAELRQAEKERTNR